MAPLKLASGCDRRCTFCAIPSFRGSFVSRRPSDVVAEARWLAGEGVRELFLVSENSTSYGKDLGDLRLLETLLPELAAIDGVERVRVSYLQPAETRPGLVEAIAKTAGVSDYFDLSFQHASATVLRRMRRFGDPESFLGLLDRVRALAPAAGVRSNVIVGFPGETDDDLQTLCDFLVAARLDVTGVFGYSDEDGTEAETMDGKLDDDEIRARVEHVTDLVEQLTSERAEERVGDDVVVLVESVTDGVAEGRADHQGPEVDGTTRLTGRRTRHASVTWSRRSWSTARAPTWSPPRSGSRSGRVSDEVGTSGNWNLPNVLTGIRILIVPFYGVALLQDGGDSILWRTVAAVLFFVAMITDKVDGDIARARGLVTNFGKIADPIADKAMTGHGLHRPVDRGRHLVVGDHPGAAPRVVGDPAPALDPPAGRGRRRPERQGQDRAAGGGADRAVAAAPPAAPAAPRRRGVPLLRLPGRAGRRGRDDHVVRLRVLPRRLAPASGAPHPLRRGFAGCSRAAPPTRGRAGAASY